MPLCTGAHTGLSPRGPGRPIWLRAAGGPMHFLCGRRLIDNGRRNAIMSPYCQMDSEKLEEFSMGRASSGETDLFEEHLLVCDRCRERFEEIDRFTRAMRSAAAELSRETAPRQSWWRLPRLIPSLACLALLVIGVTFVTRFTATPTALLAIALTATRGAVPCGTAPAGRAMAVSPDLIGIAAPGPYRLEVVDERGRITWEGRYNPTAGPATVPAQRVGAHFVRVYATGGELLREYGLTIHR